uniref:(northern house mosquito) hypothetical protein n=1 Tax=Culex pipiens TaxID=7175 RepID=A0A8D8CTM9_CULPI
MGQLGVHCLCLATHRESTKRCHFRSGHSRRVSVAAIFVHLNPSSVWRAQAVTDLLVACKFTCAGSKPRVAYEFCSRGDFRLINILTGSGRRVATGDLVYY